MIDRDDPPEAGRALAMIVVITKSVDLTEIEELLREAQRFDTVTSMLDPTRWMREHRSVEASARVARAFLAFRKVIDEESS